MKMDFSGDYLKKLAWIPTPEWEKGMGTDEREQQGWDYCQLRNAAKDLLRDSTDKETKNKVSELVEKLKINIE